MVLLLACLWATIPSRAASPDLPAIHGSVKDPLGAIVAGAAVELLQNEQPVASAKSDAEGNYTLQPPAPGRYQVRVSAPALLTTVSEPVYASGSGEIRVDMTLGLGVLEQNVTVTATGTPTPGAQIGASVTLLTGDQYRHALDIQEPLRLVPGLQMTQTGQMGGTSSLFIRGADRDANKVLVDGIPASFIGGFAEFATLPAAGIDKVEVLRGPNSALYGSDALAGVVSLTSTRGTTPVPKFTYSAEGGNFGTNRQEGAAGGAHKEFDYFSTFAAVNTHGDIPRDSFHNAVYAGNIGWAPKPDTSLRLTLRHVYNNVELPNGIQLYGIPDNAGQTDRNTYAGLTFQNQTTDRWHNLVRYGAVRLRELYTDIAPTGIPYDAFGLGYPSWYIGAPVTLHGANGYTAQGQAVFQYTGTYPSQTLNTTNRDFVYAQSDYRINAHLTALAGFKYESERGENASTGYSLTRVSRGNYSYTFQASGDVSNRLYYTVGSGIENNALFGVKASPRATIAYYLTHSGSSRLLNGTKVRASFGEGIKEPSLYQQASSLYNTLSALSNGSSLIAKYGITQVGAESSRTFDGGVDREFAGGRGKVGVTYFHNDFTNGVEYVPQQGLIGLGVPSDVAHAAQYGAYVNSLAVLAKGMEAELEYRIGNSLALRGGYTYLDAVVQRSFSSDALSPTYNPSFPTIAIGAYSPLVGARPFRHAPNSGYFAVSYDRARWAGSITGTLIGQRDDSDFLLYDKDGKPSLLLPNRNLDAAYQRLDVSGSYRVNRFVTIYSAAQNVLSEHYSESFGFPALPLTFRSGVRMTWGGESWK